MGSGSEIFVSNLARWKKMYPQAADKLAQLKPSHSKLDTSNGYVNIRIEQAGKEIFFHDPKDPIQEAKAWFQKVDTHGLGVLFIYGPGLGYYYQAAKDWLRQDKTRYIVFLEEDLELLHALLQTELGTEILNDQQVWLLWLDPDFASVDNIAQAFALKPYRIAASNYYENHLAEQVMQVRSKVNFFMNLKAGTTSEYVNHGKLFFSNFFQNILCLPESKLGNSLYRKFSGIPAIICGAGPSLQKNAALLKHLNDRAIIFAGGTAMNALNAFGVLPHFGVGIDPNPAQYTRLIMNTAYETPFFYRNRMNHEAFKVIHGDRLYTTGSAGYDLASWFEKKFHIEGKDVSEGCNVLNFSLAIAHAMGCNPLILVGIDLAYTDSRSYAPGLLSHPIHDRKDFLRTKTPEEELLVKQDIYGQPTFTLWKWISESMWYADFAKNNKDVVILNATEGGLGFPGIPNVTLIEAAEKVLLHQYDLDSMLYGEIQNAYPPPSLTPDSVTNALDELAGSLENCILLTKTVQEDFEDSERKLHAGKEVPANLLNEEALMALGGLEQEAAYQYILKVFNENYLQIFSREYQRLAFDEEILSEQEVLQKKLGLNAGRYGFLKDTARYTLDLMKKALANWKEKSFQILMKASHKGEVPIAPQENYTLSGYIFEKGVFSIEDPENQISYKEQLTEQVAAPATLLYPNGQTKYELHRKGSSLHGPSIFYSQEGKPLAKNWFIEGRKQGFGLTWYPSGALQSRQRFKDGQKEGVQEYFYSDGNIKSVIHYSKGILDGEVLLYHPNGQLKRKLHFKEGKRNGLEQIWNEVGMLTLEAGFEDDMPKGIARKWYDNGNIAAEIIYETPTKYSVREWDENGTSFHLLKHKQQEDYFDQVARQAEVLTNSLEQVINQVGNVAPVLFETAGTPSEEKNPFKDSIEDLKKELIHLRELNKALEFETGLDQANLEEAIWKSPAIQRELEKELGHMTDEMTHGINKIHQSLAGTLQKLAEKLNKKETK